MKMNRNDVAFAMSVLNWTRWLEEEAQKIKVLVKEAAEQIHGSILKITPESKVISKSTIVTVDEIYARLKLEIIYMFSKECSKWHKKPGRYVKMR